MWSAISGAGGGSGSLNPWIRLFLAATAAVGAKQLSETERFVRSTLRHLDDSWLKSIGESGVTSADSDMAETRFSLFSKSIIEIVLGSFLFFFLMNRFFTNVCNFLFFSFFSLLPVGNVGILIFKIHWNIQIAEYVRRRIASSLYSHDIIGCFSVPFFSG